MCLTARIIRALIKKDHNNIPSRKRGTIEMSNDRDRIVNLERALKDLIRACWVRGQVPEIKEIISPDIDALDAAANVLYAGR